jgi:glutamyl-tRNA reductase
MPIVFGMNHRSAPLAVRERVAFPEAAIGDAVARLRGVTGVEEALLLSTCNRTELIVTTQVADAGAILAGFLRAERPVTAEELERHCYVHRGHEAVRHVFRTTSSLDSMVIGEAQILGQVKDAYATAARVGCLGPVLDALFRRAFSAAKRVRTETGIARNPVSIACAAVSLARDIFGDLHDNTVLIVGAGKMARLAALHLKHDGVRSVVVVNRSFQNADDLARELGGRAVPFDRLFEEMERADIVIASTAAPHRVVGREDALRVSRARRGRPIFFIDIAVPRDVDPAVNEIDNVYLYDLDDLQGVVKANLDDRLHELQSAEAIIEHEVDAFLVWRKSLEVTPTIVELRQRLHEMALGELERFHSRLGDLSPEQVETVRHLAVSLVNKLLHQPTMALKRAAALNGGGLRVDLIREIFGMDARLPAAAGTAAGQEEPGGADEAPVPHQGQQPVRRQEER